VGILVGAVSALVARQQVVGGPRHRDPALARSGLGGYRQQADSAEPVQRVVDSAMVQAKTCLGERPGQVACQPADAGERIPAGAD
jgi:hypothetical protein